MNVLEPIPTRPGESIDEILLRHFAEICESLDLPPHMFKLAKDRYEKIGELLCDPCCPLHRWKPQIYVQGSTRTETTVKPPSGDEFDIDLVCQLTVDRPMTARELFASLKEAISQNGTYAKLLSVKNRCVRLTYANDFHMDITPAVADLAFGPENIRVTDCPTDTMKASNPKDFASWFAQISAVPPVIREATRKAGRAEVYLNASAGVEPVSDPKASRPILNRIVQIFKRHRDIAFEGQEKNAPISAIITTTSANSYQRLATTGHESLYDLIIAIAQDLPNSLGPSTISNGHLIHTVPNPANREENFADKWLQKPERQAAFFDWQHQLVEYLVQLRTSVDQGEDVLLCKLSDGFGKKLVTQLEVTRGRVLKHAAATAKIGIGASGLILPAAHAVTAIRPQTFHGQPHCA